MDRVEVVVIGAGVVGLAVARELAIAGCEVLVLEAQNVIGAGTSSRNSEVIHAGIYYAAGSLKARLCVAGREALYRYCLERDIPHRQLGKLIVATSAEEAPVLAKYRAQALANGVRDLEPLSAAQVHALEPAVRCVAGMMSPSTGIIDSHALMLAYQADLEARGGTVLLGCSVTGGILNEDSVVLHVAEPEPASLEADFVVNCAGLQAQEVSHGIRGLPADSIPPRRLAKGHYFSLSGRAPFRHLVYPLANSAGLGVHVTLDLAGATRFGPDVHWINALDYGFEEGLRPAFAAAIRRYYPDLDEGRLVPGYTGIRPKTSDPTQPAGDFCIRGPPEHGGHPYVALYGIESPGLTASLALAKEVAQLCPIT